MNWRRAHWVAGTITLSLFPLAGVYMRFVAKVPELTDAPRLVFRSRFLLLLLIAAVNLARSNSASVGRLQSLASAIILAAPIPLIASFFLDPARGVHGSWWTTWTMRSLFLAAVLLAFSNRPRSRA